MKSTHHSKGAVTRADLRAAVYDLCSGLARREAAELVDLVLTEIAETLASGEPVKLRGFGAFKVAANARGSAAIRGRRRRRRSSRAVF